MLNKDFKEFVGFLNSTGVEYLVVGGYALAASAIRDTGDIDIWVVRPKPTRVRFSRDSTLCFHTLGSTQADFFNPFMSCSSALCRHGGTWSTPFDGVRFDLLATSARTRMHIATASSCRSSS